MGDRGVGSVGLCGAEVQEDAKEKRLEVGAGGHSSALRNVPQEGNNVCCDRGLGGQVLVDDEGDEGKEDVRKPVRVLAGGQQLLQRLCHDVAEEGHHVRNGLAAGQEGVHGLVVLTSVGPDLLGASALNDLAHRGFEHMRALARAHHPHGPLVLDVGVHCGCCACVVFVELGERCHLRGVRLQAVEQPLERRELCARNNLVHSPTPTIVANAQDVPHGGAHVVLVLAGKVLLAACVVRLVLDFLRRQEARLEHRCTPFLQAHHQERPHVAPQQEPVGLRNTVPRGVCTPLTILCLLQW